MLKKILLVFACMLGLMSFSQSVPAQQQVSSQDTGTILVCEKWLTLMDEGQYAQSWETASSYFKSMVTKDQWAQQASIVRSSLGNMISRNFRDQQQKTNLPGAPDGQYVITSFSAVFKNKASAIETVILMKDNDGQWRLAGYFIK